MQPDLARSFRHFAAPLALALALAPAAASAQDAGTEAARHAVFTQLLDDPADVALMAEYARLSVEMRDFEAAVATLERLLDIDPDNGAARVELGVAWFSLGSYAVAEYHFAAAATAGLTGAEAATVARYRAEIAARTESSTVSGRIAVGITRQEEDDSIGNVVNGQLEWRHDLDGPNVTLWVTDIALRQFTGREDDTEDSTRVTLRTGPEFRLTGDAYGPRLQPYLEATRLFRPNAPEGDETYAVVGLAYQNPISADFSVFADVAAGFVRIPDGTFSPNESDYAHHEAVLGAVYRPSRDTRLRFQIAATRSAEFEYLEYEGVIARLDLQHEFETGLGARRWATGAYVGGAERVSDAGLGDATEHDLTYGLWLRAFVYEDFYIETRAARLDRDTDDPFFGPGEETETVMSMQLGWEF